MKKLGKVILLASSLGVFGVPSLYAALAEETFKSSPRAPVKSTPPSSPLSDKTAPASTPRSHATVKRTAASLGASLGLELEPKLVGPALSSSGAETLSATPNALPSDPSPATTLLVSGAGEPPSIIVENSLEVAPAPATPLALRRLSEETPPPSHRPRFSPFTFLSLLCCGSSNPPEELEPAHLPPLVSTSGPPPSLPASIRRTPSSRTQEGAEEKNEEKSGYADVSAHLEEALETEDDTLTPAAAAAVSSSAPLTNSSFEDKVVAVKSSDSVPSLNTVTSPSEKTPQPKRKSCWPWIKKATSKAEEAWTNVEPFIGVAIRTAISVGQSFFLDPATKAALNSVIFELESARYVRSDGATIAMKTHEGTRIEITAPPLLCARRLAPGFPEESRLTLSVLLAELGKSLDYGSIMSIIHMFYSYHDPESPATLDFVSDSGKLSLVGYGHSIQSIYIYDLVKKFPEKQKTVKTILTEFIAASSKRSETELKLKESVEGNFLAPGALSRTKYAELLEKKSPFVLDLSVTALGGVDSQALERLSSEINPVSSV